jgi:hypothetical protein
MKATRQLALIALFAASLALPAFATTTQAQPVETGLVTLADSNIEYFSRGEGEAIVLLPGATLTVGYLDGLAEALAGWSASTSGARARVRVQARGSRSKRWRTM